MPDHFAPFRALLPWWEVNHFALTLSKAHWRFVLVSCSISAHVCLLQMHVQLIRAFISRFIFSLSLVHLPTNCAGASDNCVTGYCDEYEEGLNILHREERKSPSADGRNWTKTVVVWLAGRKKERDPRFIIIIWSRLRTLSQDTVEVCPTLSGGGRMRQIQQLRGAWWLCQFLRLYRGRLRLDQKAGQLWKSLETVCRSRPKWLSSNWQTEGVSDGGVQVQRGKVTEKRKFS